MKIIMSKIILCDIDGTVANNEHRQHFLKNKKDWKGFFDDMINDIPIHNVINKVIEEKNAGKEIVFITGRPESYRNVSMVWLSKYFSFNFGLLMREDKDQRNKVIVKKDIFEKKFSKSEISYVIDNDKDLLKLWSELGLKTVDASNI